MFAAPVLPNLKSWRIIPKAFTLVTQPINMQGEDAMNSEKPL